VGVLPGDVGCAVLTVQQPPLGGGLRLLYFSIRFIKLLGRSL
jgi:hypothetical protein